MAIILTPEQVTEITGVVVQYTDVFKAQTIIETFTGVVLDSNDPAYTFPQLPDTLSTTQAKDLRACKMAVAYQSAWALEQPDILSRVSATSLSQDGVSVTAEDTAAWTLAPLAKRSLLNCSWSRDYSVKVVPATSYFRGDFTRDDDHGWRPL